MRSTTFTILLLTLGCSGPRQMPMDEPPPPPPPPPPEDVITRCADIGDDPVSGMACDGFTACGLETTDDGDGQCTDRSVSCNAGMLVVLERSYACGGPPPPPRADGATDVEPSWAAPFTAVALPGVPCVDGHSCVLERVEDVDGPEFRSATPVVAIDRADRPTVVFNRADEGFHGVVADLDPALSEPGLSTIPGSLAEAAVVPSDGGLYVWAADGFDGAQLFDYVDGSWTSVGGFLTSGGGVGALARDGAGHLFAVAPGDGVHHRLFFDGGTWHRARLAGKSQIAAAIALGPSGPELWIGERDDTTYDGSLVWLGPTTERLELATGPQVRQMRAASLASGTVAAVLADDGVLTVHATTPGGVTSQVVHTNPTAICPEPTAGAVCDVDADFHSPLAIFGHASGWLLLTFREHVGGSLTAECNDTMFSTPGLPPPGRCEWSGSVARSFALALDDDDGAGTDHPLPGTASTRSPLRPPAAGTGVLGPDGSIHVAWSDAGHIYPIIRYAHLAVPAG